jgi:CheY-like chemotaxis protein
MIEDLLLTMGQAVLSTYGYRVLTARSGQQALNTLSTNSSIDLVITDLIMPTMSGRELVEQVHQLAPTTRILCTSGTSGLPGTTMKARTCRSPSPARISLQR